MNKYELLVKNMETFNIMMMEHVGKLERRVDILEARLGIPKHPKLSDVVPAANTSNTNITPPTNPL